MKNLLLIIASIFIFSESFGAKILKKDHVEVRLVSAHPELSSIKKIGVHFKIDPEWHIYWKNSGDSGVPPKFQLQGGEIKKVSWPYPVRLPLGDLINFGYEHEVLFPLEITQYSPQMTLKLEWLVCKIECIPGFGELDATDPTIPVDTPLYEKFAQKVPSSPLQFSAQFIEKTGEHFVFELNASTDRIAAIRELHVFPENGENFATASPQKEVQKNGIKIFVPISANADFKSSFENFTIVAHNINGSTTFFTQTVELKEKAVPWLWGILLAFLGGVILNLMPCVFPVLFLKAFGFLKEKDTAAIRKSSWYYSLGVIATFLVIGGILMILRLTGESVGWGFQLQHPWLVYVLSLLFFALALNFFGFFEMGDALVSRTSGIQSHRFFSGSFGTGVLAVIVATPCTAPFMGSALGLTLVLPAFQSFLIFASLGIGMAIPMLLLAYIPRLAEKLPRSGNWMILVKQFMAFPLFATSLWLLWVLGNQNSSDAVFTALASFLTFSAGIWILNSAKSFLVRILGVIVLIVGPMINLYVTEKIAVKANEGKAISAWAPYDEAVIAEKQKTQAVFIDFTASWCITCQVNKRAVLETLEIQELFKTENVFLVRADWTNHDSVITKALARHGRNSVPFYIFYNKLGTQTLPEILTKDLVKNLFKKEN